MKTYRLKPSVTAPLTALTLGLATLTMAQAQSPHYVQTPASAGPVQAMTPDAESFALSKITGKPLRSATGEELGNVSDFLIEPSSGAVHFAVVPSGRGQTSETYRVVPISAIDANNPEAFTLKLSRDQWDRVGTLVEQRLQGQVSLDADFRQRLAQQFNLTNEVAAGATEFLRVSQLKGQAIRSTNDQLGTIEDVLIDVRHKTAAAVLTPTTTFGSAAQKFLVPFQQLQFTAGAQGGITTNLTRGHFRQTQQANSSLTPTGYPSTSAPFTQANQNQQGFGATGQSSVTAAASAVQQAIARDQAAAGVQVVPESRIVLRGSVQNEQKKLDIERAAVQAAPGVPIENQITVRRW